MQRCAAADAAAADAAARYAAACAACCCCHAARHAALCAFAVDADIWRCRRYAVYEQGTMAMRYAAACDAAFDAADAAYVYADDADDA